MKSYTEDRIVDAAMHGGPNVVRGGAGFSYGGGDTTVAPATLSDKAELVAARLEQAVCRLKDIRYRVHGEADPPEPAQRMDGPIVSSAQKPDPVSRSVNRALAGIEDLFSQIEKLEKTL